MGKKRYLESDFFEGYSLIGIVCGLPDFRVTHFINRHGHLNLKKYGDFSLSGQKTPAFSWFHFSDKALRREYFFIQNKNGTDILLSDLRNFDYLLLLYGNLSPAYLDEFLSALRQTPHVVAAFEQDFNRIKNGDLLIEQNERHALVQLSENIRRPNPLI